MSLDEPKPVDSVLTFLSGYDTLEYSWVKATTVSVRLRILFVTLQNTKTQAGRLLKVPESFERYVSTTTRQYVGHVVGLVKSYWPQTPLDALGKVAKADCTDEKFHQYLQETSVVVDQIVESLNKPESP